MQAVSISIPRRGTTVNAAVADTVPVAELIPHLVEDISPGEVWVLHRAVGTIRPEHSLNDAGVRPGERLTLDIATAPAPPSEAVEELRGAVGANYAAWALAICAALVTWRARPLWNPLEFHHPSTWGVSTSVLVLIGAVVAFATAAATLHDRRFSYVAPVVAFGVGLNINVLCACACAALMVWCRGPARIFTVTVLLCAAVNMLPSVTLLLAVLALAYSGQLAIGIARIKLPKVPATGIFSRPVYSSAGNVVEVHSTLVVALCVVIVASVVQIAPWGTVLSPWTVALLMAVMALGISARDARPIHATAVALMSGIVGLWLACHGMVGVVFLAALVVPALRIKSPLVGRLVDWLEMLAFAACVPLAVYATGVFELLRGIG